MDHEWTKLSVMYYFRFVRGFPIVVSEMNMPNRVGYYEYFTLDGGRADILAINQNLAVYEVEVKTSLEDFTRDKKKPKHHRYRTKNQYSPNYFYYTVPEKIVNEIYPLVESLYGLMAVKQGYLGNVRIVRKAQRLPGEMPKDFIKNIYQRLSAENIKLRYELLGREKEERTI